MHAPAMQVGPWTSQVIEGILKKLAALQKPMKYVCHVSLTQRAGAGLHAAVASRWNAKTDGALAEQSCLCEAMRHSHTASRSQAGR